MASSLKRREGYGRQSQGCQSQTGEAEIRNNCCRDIERGKKGKKEALTRECPGTEAASRRPCWLRSRAPCRWRAWVPSSPSSGHGGGRRSREGPCRSGRGLQLGRHPFAFDPTISIFNCNGKSSQKGGQIAGKLTPRATGANLWFSPMGIGSTPSVEAWGAYTRRFSA